MGGRLARPELERLAVLDRGGEAEGMRDRCRLDGEELRLAAPPPAVRARLVPDPDMPEPACVPGEVDRHAGPRVANAHTPLREVRHREQAASRTVERPAIAALARAVEEQHVGPARGIGRGNRRPVRLAELVRQTCGKVDLDLGLEELEPECHVLEHDERGRLERLHMQASHDVGTRELDRALEREPVAPPFERRPRGLGREHLPGVVRGTSVEAVLHVAHAAHRTGVRGRELPAATVRGGPHVLREVACHRSLRGERWTAQHPPAGRHVDQLEDLRPVGGIDDREELLRAKDDHGVGRLGAASSRRRV